jgi:hypothetical protein
MSFVLKTGCLRVMKRVHACEMFSFELTTNPWMFYEFSVPAPEWYEISMIGWRGKSVKYHPLACFYVGWFGAVFESDEIRTRYQATVRRYVLAMGAHSTHRTRPSTAHSTCTGHT